MRFAPKLRTHAGVRSLKPALFLALGALTASCVVEQAADESAESSADSITIDVNATYTIVGVGSNKCVGITGSSTANLATAEIEACNGAKNQQFRAESMGGGFFRLKNVNSGSCLDVNGASLADGAAVIQWTCGTGTNQQWSFTDVATGVERITARHSGKALDVTGQSTTAGAKLEQWTASNQTNQQFKLVAGTSSTGGGGTTDAGAPPPSGTAFSPCRFHFATIDSTAKSNTSTLQQIDSFTPGWMGQNDTFDMGYVCTEGNPGGALAGKVPVIVAYVAAFYAKRHAGLKDCNVGTPSLCQTGSAFILQNLTNIVNVYKSYAQGFASCYGTSRPIIFEMEPDWYQYTGSSQSQPMTPAQAGTIMSQFVTAVKSVLPNAFFSMDISPWVAPNNGSDNGKTWYANFNMSLFTFINTSGGGTDAGSAKIRSSNNMTWAGVHQVTGKPILADTGYGANGISAGPDPAWDVPANINARMADGVVSIAQYNPSSTWGSTISGIRSQLKAPTSCP